MESVECETNAQVCTSESEDSAEVNEEIGGYVVSAEANKDVEGGVSEALDGGKGRVRKPPGWLKDFVWGEKGMCYVYNRTRSTVAMRCVERVCKKRTGKQLEESLSPDAPGNKVLYIKYLVGEVIVITMPLFAVFSIRIVITVDPPIFKIGHINTHKFA
ncbi:hypothetical protein NDU88_005907 [Pleurodeles waltl]|uniref:Uncharacterized protein n=1 Tax=Pleurodeles waltl TaxID=8319 RepID=A0AAV7PGX9_PLEWA|nr:hypothetical protein NDU88_005907 [Pleurodeles waltl]